MNSNQSSRNKTEKKYRASFRLLFHRFKGSTKKQRGAKEYLKSGILYPFHSPFLGRASGLFLCQFRHVFTLEGNSVTHLYYKARSQREQPINPLLLLD